MFSFDDYTAVNGTNATVEVQLESYAAEGLINLEIGKYYELVAKFYMKDKVDAAFPSNILTNIKGEGADSYQTIGWNLTDITERDKWVAKTQTIQYIGDGTLSAGATISSKMAMKITQNYYPSNGSGTFYIDDITMVETTPSHIEGSKSKQNLKVYPNPSFEQIFIETSVGSTLNLYNVSGALVKSKVALSATEKMDLSDLSEGIYMLKTSEENKVLTTKIKVKK